MTVRWTATAFAELDQLLSYIAADNPSAAAAVTDEIRETLRRIAVYPMHAPLVYRGNVRAIAVGRFDYRVFYQLRGKELIIRNVRSTKRQRPWDK